MHHAVFSGPQNQALRLNATLAARGWETIVVLPDEEGNAAGRLREAGIRVELLPMGRLRATFDPRTHLRLVRGFTREVDELRELIRQLHVDLVLIGGLVNVQSAIAARREGTPVVWQILDSRAPRALRAAIMPIVRRYADCLMFTGEGLIEQHGGRSSLRPPIEVYLPPVDTGLFQVSATRRVATRAELGVAEDAIVVGTVANLNPQKGIEYFIRAATRIHAADPRAVFVIVGAGYRTHSRYRQMLAAERARSGVPESHFVFAGARADVERWYPAMDVKLITSVSRSEGVATTALEAMACGVPVVTTRVGALAEVVEEGVTGFVVPAYDDEAIASAVLRLAKDPAMRRQMGAEGRQRAVTRFDVGVCAAVHLRAFEAAVQHRRWILQAVMA